MEGRVEGPTMDHSDTKEVCTVRLGKEAWDRWHQIRKTEGLDSDSETACLLLKWYESHHQKQWVVECVYCQGMLSVSLMCGQHRHLDNVIMSVSKVTSLSATDIYNLTTPEVKSLSSGDVGTSNAENVCVKAEAGVEKRTRSQVSVSHDDGEDGDEDTDTESQFAEPRQTHSCDSAGVTVTYNDTSVVSREESVDDAVGGVKRQKQVHGCEVCGQIFPSSDALVRHSQTVHQVKEKPQPVKHRVTKGGTQFECLTCKKSFPSKSGIESHTCIPNNKRHCCEFCQKCFKSSVSLGVHRQKFHSAVKSSSSKQSEVAHTKKGKPSNKRCSKTEQPSITRDCGQYLKKSNYLCGQLKQAYNQSVPSDREQSVTCEVCQKSFKFKRSLTLHMKSHSSQTQRLDRTQEAQSDQPPTDSGKMQPPQNTDVCTGENSPQEEDIAEPSLSCSFCARTFKSKRGLEGHKQREHTKQWPRNNKCDKCGAAFRFKTQLTKHKRSHRDERPFSCGQCGAKFKSSASLDLHESWHEDMRSSVCHLCGKSCLGMKALSRHIKMHHGSEHMVEKPYSCSECTASFTSLSKLTSHVGVHSHQNYVCRECGQAFRSEHILAIHKRRHTGETPFQCAECPERFIDKSRLKRHQLQHHLLSQELCHVCGAGFPSKAHLAIHIQRHTTERPFKCSQCGKAYKTTGDLKSHMMSHSDDRPFQCSHCSYAARTKAMLNKHVRKHTGERPYRCEQCSASFTYFSCLSAHRKLHSNTKPFVCEVCSASFFTAYNLRLHSRKHSGERPYTCPLCPESFSWHSGLKCHMKKHSGSSGSGPPEMETLA